jgi:hypothetical protein
MKDRRILRDHAAGHITCAGDSLDAVAIARSSGMDLSHVRVGKEAPQLLRRPLRFDVVSQPDNLTRPYHIADSAATRTCVGAGASGDRTRSRSDYRADGRHHRNARLNPSHHSLLAPPDRDITTSEMKRAWHEGRKDLFYPYGKTFAQTIHAQDRIEVSPPNGESAQVRGSRRCGDCCGARDRELATNVAASKGRMRRLDTACGWPEPASQAREKGRHQRS